MRALKYKYGRKFGKRYWCDWFDDEQSFSAVHLLLPNMPSPLVFWWRWMGLFHIFKPLWLFVSWKIRNLGDSNWVQPTDFADVLEIKWEGEKGSRCVKRECVRRFVFWDFWICYSAQTWPWTEMWLLRIDALLLGQQDRLFLEKWNFPRVLLAYGIKWAPKCLTWSSHTVLAFFICFPWNDS